MGKVRSMLLNFLTNLEEKLNEKVKSLENNSIPIPDEDKEPIELSEEECLLINASHTDENSEVLKSLDYKTYLLLSILPSIKLGDEEPRPLLDIFISEPLLMENWLEHLSNLNRVKQFQFLIKNQKILSGKYSSVKSETSKRSIKCLRDLPLQKQTLN